jgi:hypothetical protein
MFNGDARGFERTIRFSEGFSGHRLDPSPEARFFQPELEIFAEGDRSDFKKNMVLGCSKWVKSLVI